MNDNNSNVFLFHFIFIFKCIWRWWKNSIRSLPRVLLQTFFFSSSTLCDPSRVSPNASAMFHMFFYHLFTFALHYLMRIKWIFMENLFLLLYFVFHHKIYGVNKFVADVARSRRSLVNLWWSAVCQCACLHCKWQCIFAVFADFF